MDHNDCDSLGLSPALEVMKSPSRKAIAAISIVLLGTILFLYTMHGEFYSENSISRELRHVGGDKFQHGGYTFSIGETFNPTPTFVKTLKPTPVHSTDTSEPTSEPTLDPTIRIPRTRNPTQNVASPISTFAPSEEVTVSPTSEPTLEPTHWRRTLAPSPEPSSLSSKTFGPTRSFPKTYGPTRSYPKTYGPTREYPKTNHPTLEPTRYDLKSDTSDYAVNSNTFEYITGRSSAKASPVPTTTPSLAEKTLGPTRSFDKTHSPTREFDKTLGPTRAYAKTLGPTRSWEKTKHPTQSPTEEERISKANLLKANHPDKLTSRRLSEDTLNPTPSHMDKTFNPTPDFTLAPSHDYTLNPTELIWKTLNPTPSANLVIKSLGPTRSWEKTLAPSGEETSSPTEEGTSPPTEESLADAPSITRRTLNPTLNTPRSLRPTAVVEEDSSETVDSQVVKKARHAPGPGRSPKVKADADLDSSPTAVLIIKTLNPTPTNMGKTLGPTLSFSKTLAPTPTIGKIAPTGSHESLSLTVNPTLSIELTRNPTPDFTLNPTPSQLLSFHPTQQVADSTTTTDVGSTTVTYTFNPTPTVLHTLNPTPTTSKTLNPTPANTHNPTQDFSPFPTQTGGSDQTLHPTLVSTFTLSPTRSTTKTLAPTPSKPTIAPTQSPTEEQVTPAPTEEVVVTVAPTEEVVVTVAPTEEEKDEDSRTLNPTPGLRTLNPTTGQQRSLNPTPTPKSNYPILS